VACGVEARLSKNDFFQEMHQIVFGSDPRDMLGSNRGLFSTAAGESSNHNRQGKHPIVNLLHHDFK
jgi:hypothetical protein